MMKQKLKASLILVVFAATIGMLGTVGYSYAQTDPNTTDPLAAIFTASVTAGATINGAGAGAIAAAILVIVRVIGKNLNSVTNQDPPTVGSDGKPLSATGRVEVEALDISQLLITVGIGVGLGVVLPLLHFNLGSAFGSDFIGLYLVNNLIRPIFRNVEKRVK